MPAKGSIQRGQQSSWEPAGSGQEGQGDSAGEGGKAGQVRVICSTQNQLTGTEAKQDLVGTLDCCKVVKLYLAQQGRRALDDVYI